MIKLRTSFTSAVFAVTFIWLNASYSIHVPGGLLKWLNFITAPGSVSNEPGSVTWLATKYLKTDSWVNHTENFTTLWPQNISFWPKIKILSKQLTWSNSNTAGISLDSRLKYSKITHRYGQKLSVHLVLVLITSHWYRFHPFYLSISPVLSHKCQRVFTWASWTTARHAGSFDCLMTSLIMITMTMAEGTVHMHGSSPAKFPTKHTEE